MPLKHRQIAFRPTSLPANQLKTSPSLPSLSYTHTHSLPSLSSSPFASWKWQDCTISRGVGGKSKAAEGDCVVSGQLPRVTVSLRLIRDGGKVAVGWGCISCSRVRKKAQQRQRSWNPESPCSALKWYSPEEFKEVDSISYQFITQSSANLRSATVRECEPCWVTGLPLIKCKSSGSGQSTAFTAVKWCFKPAQTAFVLQYIISLQSSSCLYQLFSYL